jgi:hypothetical protein
LPDGGSFIHTDLLDGGGYIDDASLLLNRLVYKNLVENGGCDNFNLLDGEGLLDGCGLHRLGCGELIRPGGCLASQHRRKVRVQL